MITVTELDEQENRRRLFLLCMCGCLVVLAGKCFFGIMELLNNGRYPQAPLRLGNIALVLATMGWLVARRNRLTVRECTIAGLIVLTPTPLIHWYSEEVALASGLAWDPFIGHWLTILLAAIIFPGTPRAVFLVVSALTFIALAHPLLWTASGIGAPRMDLWITIFYWLIGVAVVLLRRELGRVLEQYRKARAALVTLRHMTLASRALRDGINTPLQNIEVIAFLQRHYEPGTSTVTETLERNVGRVRHVLEAMRYDDTIDWSESDVAFQAEYRLAALQAALIHDVDALSGQAGSGPPRRDAPDESVRPRHPSEGSGSPTASI